MDQQRKSQGQQYYKRDEDFQRDSDWQKRQNHNHRGSFAEDEKYYRSSNNTKQKTFQLSDLSRQEYDDSYDKREFQESDQDSYRMQGYDTSRNQNREQRNQYYREYRDDRQQRRGDNEQQQNQREYQNRTNHWNDGSQAERRFQENNRQDDNNRDYQYERRIKTQQIQECDRQQQPREYRYDDRNRDRRIQQKNEEDFDRKDRRQDLNQYDRSYQGREIMDGRNNYSNKQNWNEDYQDNRQKQYNNDSYRDMKLNRNERNDNQQFRGFERQERRQRSKSANFHRDQRNYRDEDDNDRISEYQGNYKRNERSFNQNTFDEWEYDREDNNRNNQDRENMWLQDTIDDISIIDYKGAQNMPVSIKCELSKYIKGRASKQKLNMIQELLCIAQGGCSIEITIKDLDKRFVSYVRQNQYKLRDININFQYKSRNDIKQNNSFQIEKEDKQQIDDAKTKEIFIFRDQNDIPGIYIMLLVFQTKYSILFEQAKNNNISFITMKQQAAIQFKTDPSRIQKLRQYFDLNIKPLSDVFIIVHKCVNMDELKKKHLLLNKQKDKLQKFFIGRNWDDHIHSPLNLDTLFFQQEFDDQFIKQKMQDFVQLPVLYFLIYASYQDGQRLQKNFDTCIINNPSIICQKKFEFSILFEYNSDFKDEKVDILEILKEDTYTYHSVVIDDPVYDLNSKKWKVKIIIIVWLHDDLKIDDKKSQQLFKEVNDILSGVQTITITEHKQIELWKFYLKQKFEEKQKQKKIQILSINNNNADKQIQLEIRSHLNSAKDVDEFKNLILVDLESMTINKAEIRIGKDILQGYPMDRIQKIFKSDIDEVNKKFPDTDIKFFIANKKYYFNVCHGQQQDFQEFDQEIQKLFQKLRKVEVSVNQQKFLDFLKEKTLDEFEVKYSVILKQIDQEKQNLVSFEDKINRIQDLLKSFQSDQIRQYVDFELDLENEVVFKHIMQKFSAEIKKYSIQSPKIIQFIIILNGEKEIIELLVNEIEIERNQFIASLFYYQIVVKQIQKQYLQKEKSQELQELRQKYNCLLDFKEKSYNNPYIWSWQDDQGPKFYSKSMNDKIDHAYRQYLNDNTKNELLLVYEFSHQPSTHKIDLQNMTITEKSSKKREFQIKWKQQQYSINNKPVKPQLNQYLIQKYQQKIFQFEVFLNEYKIIFSQDQIIQVNINSNFQREVNKNRNQNDQLSDIYKWNWQSETGVIDFPKDISHQIDVAYQTYLTNKSQNEINLNYQLGHKPATHIVDLNAMNITQIQGNKQSPIKLNQNNYQLNGQNFTKDVNDYLLDKRQKGEIKVELFLNQYKIIFSDSNIIQVNLQSNYKRNVNKIPIQQNVQIKEQQEFELILQCPSQNELQYVYAQIHQLLKSEERTIDLFIPPMKENQFKQFQNLLQDNVYKISGEIQQNQTIKITAFSEGIKQIESFVTACDSIVQFPKEWLRQNQNLLKVDLTTTDPEYNMVKNEFEKTLQRQIKAIYRIQNKDIYTNFYQEKEKMINRNKARNMNLLKHEEERLLWHGVRDKYPNIIYQGNREAFDVTYSNDRCMWGPGAYFAENASYSYAYSYDIKSTDDPKFAGMKVFLCCRVALGKCFNCNPDSSIKRPPPIPNLPNEQYDSVSGFTNGSNVFILYSMDVRRAYPAYEVIYQP